MYQASNWPYRWYSISNDPKAGASPSVLDFEQVDHTHDMLNRITDYMNKCPVWITSLSPGIECYICHDQIWESTLWRCDNNFLWPATLEHFVSQHKAALPPEMMKFIESRNYCPPDKILLNEDEISQIYKTMSGYRFAVRNTDGGASS